MLMTLLFSACNDDTVYGTGDYSIGEPATLNMKITVPVDKKVTPLSRSFDTDRESAIHQLVIVGFEVNSGRKLFVDLTDNLQSESVSTSAGRVYKLLNEVAIESGSGRYRLYLIANWQSAYANMTVDNIQEMSEDQIKALDFTNPNKHIVIYGDYGLPMSQVLTGTNGYYEIKAGANQLSDVKLERATAHIEFSIENGAGQGNNVPNFEPTGYTVYRIPQGAKTFADAEAIQTTYFNSSTTPIVKQPGENGSASYTFDFFMLENKQTSTNKGMTTWTQREAWDASTQTGNDYATRSFTNAPENATFVVITGNYSGPAAKNEDGTYSDTQYFGTVSYIIHLGNFNTSQSGSLDNFSANRNERHIYNITVNGANSIIANVSVTEGQVNPAVEGYLATQPIASVDAHYAKIMLEIPLTSIYPKNGTDKNKVVLKTVKNAFAENIKEVASLTDADDYKWIQFQKPTDANTFPTYAGINSDGTSMSHNGYTFAYLPQLLEEMEDYRGGDTDLSNKHFLVNGDQFIVAAFIDENIYDATTDPAINTWVGYTIPDRVMTLNPKERQSSPDEQSVTAATSAFNIMQHPVVSTYSLDPQLAAEQGIDPSTYNPFGFEQVEEPTQIANSRYVSASGQDSYMNNTATKKFFESALEWDGLTGTANEIQNPNNANGREMMFHWYPAFNTTAGVRDNTNTSFYKLTEQDGSNYSTYVFSPANDFYTVTDAIVSRNRDLDGNGSITADEIRWYIPNIIQYYIYNFGYNLVPEELRLAQYEEDMLTGVNGDKAFPRYFTVSRNTRRLFWQDHRGATSEGWNSGGPTWPSTFNNIRFVRNLGQFSNSYSADYTRMSIHDKDKRIIKFLNANICRNFSWTKPYPAANALDETYNRLPKALEYAEYITPIFGNPSTYTFDNNISINTIATATANTSMASASTHTDVVNLLNQWALDSYKKMNNLTNNTTLTQLPDGWRIPNQRELIALLINDRIQVSTSDNTTPFSNTGVFDLGISTVFSTTFIESNLWSGRTNFTIQVSGGFLAYPPDWRNTRSQGFVYLVRDVDPKTGEPIATQTTTTSRNHGRGVLRR